MMKVQIMKMLALNNTKFMLSNKLEKIIVRMYFSDTAFFFC